jgi:hypothetical protein
VQAANMLTGTTIAFEHEVSNLESRLSIRQLVQGAAVYGKARVNVDSAACRCRVARRDSKLAPKPRLHAIRELLRPHTRASSSHLLTLQYPIPQPQPRRLVLQPFFKKPTQPLITYYIIPDLSPR